MRRRWSIPESCMNNDIKLRASIDVSSEDVEKALFEQAKEEPEVARAIDELRGGAQQAADQLNQALDIDVFDLLERGWIMAPAVRRAVQLSALTPSPPAIITLDAHSIRSTSSLVLHTDVEQRALPELEITLQLIAGVQSATLAARDGRIELVALGDTAVMARLTYKDLLLKERTTGVEGAPRDPFRRPQAAPEQQAGVDFYL